MKNKVEKIVDILRKEISCVICSGEFCNCDGTHDKEKVKKIAYKILKKINPRIKIYKN